MTLRWLPALLLLAGWLARPVPAWACWCFQHEVLTPAAAFTASDAVFEGTVTGIANYRAFPGFDVLMRLWPGMGDRFSDISVRFKVINSWKDITSPAITVRTGYVCGYDFLPDRQYVVYSYRFEGNLRVDFCTRTMDTRFAAADRGYLGGLPRLPVSQAWPSPLLLGCLGLTLAMSATAVAWRVRKRPMIETCSDPD